MDTGCDTEQIGRKIAAVGCQQTVRAHLLHLPALEKLNPPSGQQPVTELLHPPGESGNELPPTEQLDPHRRKMAACGKPEDIVGHLGRRRTAAYDGDMQAVRSSPGEIPVLQGEELLDRLDCEYRIGGPRQSLRRDLAAAVAGEEVVGKRGPRT